MNQFRSRRSRLIPRSYTIFASLLALLLASQLSASSIARAQADEGDPIAKATQLNREAVEAYQAHRVDDARKLLKQALDLCDASGLEQHPIKARTLIHMGIVMIGGAKQRDAGIKQFRKALEIQPEIGLTKSLVTPELQQAFDEAKGGDKSGEAKAPPPPAAKSVAPAAPAGGDLPEGGSEPPPEAATPAPGDTAEPVVPSTGLSHEAVTRGRPGTAIPITVNVDGSLKFDKIVLAYRPNGATEFFGREMKQVDPGVFSAEIPARATSGAMVAYYIEAQDKEGEPISARGSAERPLVIALGAAAAANPSGNDDDGDDDDDDDDGAGSKFFVGLLVGSGAGYAAGNGDLDRNTQYSSGSVAVAQAGHIAPEFGYWLRPNMMLSLQLRYQYITGPTEIVSGTRTLHPANYALAAFAKATWMFGHGNLRPLFSLAVGGGEIRHVVQHPTLRDCGPKKNLTCIDTIAGGPALAGAGAGIMYNLTPRLALIAALNTQIGAPDFTFNLDANIGAAFGF
jgi:hypothetical protein